MSSKLKVLQVIPKLGYGGAETGCFDLAHYLYEEKCKSYLATNGGQLTKFVDKNKVKLFKIPVNSKNPILILINSIILSFIILFYNIDIIHARSRAPAWSCYIATKITRRKFVTTFHGTYNFKSPIKKFYNSIMVRADLVIAGSNFIFNHIQQNYSNFFITNKRKLLVIFRGINIGYFNEKNVSSSKTEQLYKDWKLDKDKFIIFLPGRLTNWKGQKIFIEAIKELKKKDNIKQFNAIILGSDQGRKVYSKQLQSLVLQYGLSQNIKFFSHCSEMPAAYKIANVVVSSSIEPEAFGRVAVEAQAMGKTYNSKQTWWFYRNSSERENRNVL